MQVDVGILRFVAGLAVLKASSFLCKWTFGAAGSEWDDCGGRRGDRGGRGGRWERARERGNGFGNWTRLFRVENDDEEEEEDCKKRKYWKGREESEGRDKGLIR